MRIVGQESPAYILVTQTKPGHGVKISMMALTAE